MYVGPPGRFFSFLQTAFEESLLCSKNQDDALKCISLKNQESFYRVHATSSRRSAGYHAHECEDELECIQRWKKIVIEIGIPKSVFVMVESSFQKKMQIKHKKDIMSTTKVLT